MWLSYNRMRSSEILPFIKMTIGVIAKRERPGGRYCRRLPMLVVSVIKHARPIFVQSGRMVVSDLS
tara:strand:+ start:393 stop:590 length:198 start_codon:yes stop_codon:yes gene_type:complete